MRAPSPALLSRPSASVDATDILTATALAVAVLAPLAPSLLAAQPHDGQRLAQLAVLLGTGVSVAVVPAIRASLLRAWAALPPVLRVAFGGVVGLGVASSATAALPGYALVEVGVLVLSATLSLIVADRVSQGPQEALRLLSRAVVVMVGFYALLFAVSQVASIAAGTRLWPHAYTGFSNIRHLNQLQTWTYGLLLLPALTAESRGWRRASLGLSAFWIALAIGSGGRGTLLALAASVVAAGLLFGPTVRRHLWTLVGVAVAGVGLHLLLVWLPAVLFEQEAYRLARPMGEARLLVWGLALERFAASPWLGVGPMQLAADAAFLADGRVAHPHNAVVQVLAEWGGGAALLVVTAVGWGLWRWGLAARRERQDRALGTFVLTLALLGAALHAMVSGVVVMPVSQLWGGLVVGAALGWYLSARRAPSAAVPGAGRAWVASALVLAAGAAVVLGAGPDAMRVDERDLANVRDTTVLTLMPRFWRAGSLLGVAPDPIPEAEAHAATASPGR
ncbi:MAG: hypothetical protein CMM84_16830 [Rhodothermaceae bacterium]|nr:hypothetical protein [Rhodothermaceae bacterium]